MHVGGSDGLMAELSTSALLQLRVDCPAGEILAIVGPSGAGKTTLLRCLAGLENRCKGRILVEGRPWLDSDRGVRLPPWRRHCGLLFQDHGLFPTMTVLENVVFAMASPDVEAAMSLLTMMHVGRLAGKRPCALSGGERQRVALCQVLARRPSLLLLDEPFSAVDMETRHALRRDVREMVVSRRMSALYVTHDLADALLVADRVMAMAEGREQPRWLERSLALLAREHEAALARCNEIGNGGIQMHPATPA